jgi:hypothetical protein
VQGVVVQFRVVDGELRKGDLIKFMNTGCEYDITELGVLAPKAVEVRRFADSQVLQWVRGRAYLVRGGTWGKWKEVGRDLRCLIVVLCGGTGVGLGGLGCL